MNTREIYSEPIDTRKSEIATDIELQPLDSTVNKGELSLNLNTNLQLNTDRQLNFFELMRKDKNNQGFQK